MEAADPFRFAALLTEAIQQIKRRESKPVRVIQDELGYALGKAGGSMVEHWRKGNLPARHADLELLARLLVPRGRLDRAWLEAFLAAAGFGAGAGALCDTLFPAVAAPATEKATAPAMAPPFQAPLTAPHFVGRGSELDTLAHSLCAPGAQRAAALVGMGGAGKSTLAVQLAHRLRTHFPDGVLWVYAADSEPLAILQTWAQLYGYDFRGLTDVENRAAAVRGVWHGRRVLIVLDDVRDPARLRPLLPGGSAAVLLTTRDRDLAVLANAQIVEVPELEEAHSLALLETIIGTPRMVCEPGAALSIVQTVGRLPLALEIVARLLARAPWQSLAEMAARLANVARRLDQLVLKDVSVRAAFDVSWQTLSEDLRRVFVTLGLFQGRSCSFAAVAATAGVTPTEVDDTLATLAALSLVTIDGPLRVRQHPLLADFAREQIVDATTLEMRWTAYYLDFAAAQQADPARIDAEMDNLMAVLEYLHIYHAREGVDQLVDALHPSWLAHAEYTLARRGYGWAVDAAVARHDAMAQARALIRLGYVDCELGDFRSAAANLQDGEAIARQVGADVLVAEALFLQVRIAIEMNDLEDADEGLDACRRIFMAIDDEVGLARTLREQGLLAYRAGNYATTFDCCHRALAIQQRLDDVPGMLASLRLLADSAMAMRDLALAVEYAERALALAETADRQAELAEAHFTLATVQRMCENLPVAQSHAEDALARFTRFGNRSFIAYTLYEQSVILGKQGRADEALACAKRACTIQEELGDNYGRVTTHLQLGDLHRARGDATAATTTWQIGLHLARDIHYPHIQEFLKRLNVAAGDR